MAVMDQCMGDQGWGSPKKHTAAFVFDKSKGSCDGPANSWRSVASVGESKATSIAIIIPVHILT